MKKLLLLVCVVYMSIACGTEVVDRRSFISADSTVNTNEGSSTEKVDPVVQNPEEPAEETKQEPEEPTLPLSTLEWNGVDTVGTSTLSVLSITREDVQ